MQVDWNPSEKLLKKAEYIVRLHDVESLPLRAIARALKIHFTYAHALYNCFKQKGGEKE